MSLPLKPGHPKNRVDRVKKVKLYPVLPYTPRSERFRWDTKGSSVSSKPIQAYRSIHYRNVASTGTIQVFSDAAMASISGQVALKTFNSNKEWKRLIAKGLNATFPYARTGGFVKPVQYYGATDSVGVTPSWHCECWGQYSGPALVNQRDNSALKEAALGRLKHKLNGYVGKAQLAAPLAESREIHRLVKQINGFGMDAVKAMLLLKRTRGKSALKFASQIWLGFGFGINPLLKDIESAANSILDYQTRQDRGVRVSGSANEDYFSTGSASPPSSIAPGVTSQINGSAHHRQGVRYVAGVDLTIRSDASYSVTDHLGLGITSMPSAIWELVPFSWVVDYFTTVGPWLDDVFYTLPGVCKYVSLSEKYQNEVRWDLQVFPNVNYKIAITGRQGGFRYFSFQRSSLTTLPTRQLRVKSLDEVAQHSLVKLLNLSSVLAGHLVTPNV